MKADIFIHLVPDLKADTLAALLNGLAWLGQAYVRSASLDKVQIELHCKSPSIPVPQATADEATADKATADKAADETLPRGDRRRSWRTYSDAEKAKAVLLADRLGNDAAAGRQLDMPNGLIGRWRRELAQQAKASEPAAPKPVADPEPVHIVPKHPAAGKAAFVPSGIKTPIDVEAKRREAFA